MEYLPFRIAGRDFVVEASCVRAIVPFDRYQDPTGERSYDAPVVDLRKRLGLPPVFYGVRPCLVVVESEMFQSGKVGFAADYVSDIIVAETKDFRGGKLRVVRSRPKWVLNPNSLQIDNLDQRKRANSLSRRNPAPTRASLPG